MIPNKPMVRLIGIIAIAIIAAVAATSSDDTTSTTARPPDPFAPIIGATAATTSPTKPYGYASLIQKYSDSSKFLTVNQLQTLLDRIYTFVNVTLPDLDGHLKCENAQEECMGSIQKGCLTAKDVFEQLNIQNGEFDVGSFEAACPMILSQMENNNCKIEEVKPKTTQEVTGKPTAIEVWGLGLLFVTIISLCSLVGVSVLPMMKKKFYKQLLTVLIGLAVGSLSGSSIFHLIPQAFNLSKFHLNHDYLNTSLMVWFGIWFFFMTERLLRVISDSRQRKEVAAKTQPQLDSSVCSPTELLPPKTPEQEMLNQSTDESNDCGNPSPVVIYDYQQQVIKASFGHQEKPQHTKHEHANKDLQKFKKGQDSAIATVAWMVIFGDGLHNFIDGLSIGAAFSESILTGVSISLAVLCEEFPHELGDFAVLLNAGMSMKQALVYNFLSACTCYVGLIVGILLGEIECSSAIFAFAAGMFLYISLVDMIPEMNEVAEESSRVSVKNAFWTLFLQNIGMGIGVFLLYALAQYQDNIGFA